MERKQKIQNLLGRLNLLSPDRPTRIKGLLRRLDDATKITVTADNKEVAKAVQKLINPKITRVAKNLRSTAQGNKRDMRMLEEGFKQDSSAIRSELRQATQDTSAQTDKKVMSLLRKIQEVSTKHEGERARLQNKSTILESEIQRVDQEVAEFSDDITTILADTAYDAKSAQKIAEEVARELEKLRASVNSRLSSIGGGNANRNIGVNGNASVLSKYTDINIVGGTGVTISSSTNDTTKQTNLTFTAGGFSPQSPMSGAVDGINTVFEFATEPALISVDQGRFMQKTSSDSTVNWTGTTTITLLVAPTFDIFAL